MTLLLRSLTSLSWNMASNIIVVAVLFLRAVVLARLLPIAVFGIYAFAAAIVMVTLIVAQFGLESAFVHRSKETEDEEEAAAVHFTITLILGVLWATILCGASLLFAEGALCTALIVLTLCCLAQNLTLTPHAILTRRVDHRRLAIIEATHTIVATLVSVVLAVAGFTIWALLSVNVAMCIIKVAGMYLVRPVWIPRLAFRRSTARYFFRFGSRTVAAVLLRTLMDRIDDIWAAYYMGKTQLGLYSRAYTFAGYPQKMILPPLASVIGGTFAELKHDRRNLSRVFFRTASYLVRCGFLLAGLLAFIAPEFIVLLLGEKWLPMMTCFRLMLIYSILEPASRIHSRLLTAIGRPGRTAKIRFVQLLVMMPTMVLLTPRWGIDGIALAVDVACLVGLTLLTINVKRFVDYSVIKMYLTPTLALLVAAALGLALQSYGFGESATWGKLLGKALAFTIIYGGLMVLFERRALLDSWAVVQSALRRRQSADTAHASDVLD